MRRIPQDDYKKLLPLKRIAEASSYSFGYVSILVQRKKLKAKKIGNKYYSTKEWFDQYLELHGRDEKKLPPEVVSELNVNSISVGAENKSPLPPNVPGGKLNSQTIAQANLKNQIDNLVERAIKNKLEAPFTPPAEFLPLENLMPPSALGSPAGEEKKKISKAVKSSSPRFKIPTPKIPLTPSPIRRAGFIKGEPLKGEKALAEVLDSEIKLAHQEALDFKKAELEADSAEPEKKLADAWQDNLRQGENELKSGIKLTAKIVNVENPPLIPSADWRIEETKETAPVNFLTSDPERPFVLKIKKLLPLILKTSAAGLVIFLAATASAKFAPQIIKFDLARALKSNLARVFQFKAAREFQYNLARALEPRSIKAVAGIKIIAGQSSSGLQFAFGQAKHIADSILPPRYSEPVSQLKDRAFELAGLENPAASDTGGLPAPRFRQAGQVAGETELAADLPDGSLNGPLISAPAAATSSAADRLAGQADLTAFSIAGPTGATTTRHMEILAMIADKAGKITDGAYDVRFALYSRSRTAADPYPSNADQNYKVWEETQKVTIKNGALRTYLGLKKDLPLLTMLASDQYYLGIRIAGDSEMTPRKRLPAAFYAFNAVNASQLAGRIIGNQAGDIPTLNSQGKNIGRLDYSLMPVEVTDFLYQATGGAINQTPAASSTAPALAAKVTDISLGGTGLTAYQKGDMLYYDSGKTLARMAIGQEGQILSIINGLPVWSNPKSSTVVLGGGGGSSIQSTSDLPEGSNLYWTDARFDARFNDLIAVSGAWTSNGSNLYRLAGNIGIGTSSPYAKLTVWGSGAGTGQLVNFVNSASTTLLTVLENGNVGIGTTTPAYTVDINGDLRVTGWLYFANGTSMNSAGLGSAGSVSNNGDAIITADLLNTGIGDVIFKTGPNTRLTILNNGNVGIGTSTSYAKLTVWGSGDGTGQLVNFVNSASSSLLTVLENGNVGMGTSSPLAKLAIQGTAGQPILNIASSTGASLLYINAAGQVGIGTLAMATGGEEDPKMQIAGAVAANYYCDANGNHCVNASNGWGFSGAFVGTTTAQTDGDFATSTLVGYQAANDLCAAEFADSHFCRTDEIIYTIQSRNIDNFGGTAWIAEGPPGYTANANDCNGWKSASATALGAFWLLEANGGGAGWLTNCSNIKPISCCR